MEDSTYRGYPHPPPHTHTNKHTSKQQMRADIRTCSCMRVNHMTKDHNIKRHKCKYWMEKCLIPLRRKGKHYAFSRFVVTPMLLTLLLHPLLVCLEPGALRPTENLLSVLYHLLCLVHLQLRDSHFFLLLLHAFDIRNLRFHRCNLVTESTDHIWKQHRALEPGQPSCGEAWLTLRDDPALYCLGCPLHYFLEHLSLLFPSQSNGPEYWETHHIESSDWSVHQFLTRTTCIFY